MATHSQLNLSGPDFEPGGKLSVYKPLLLDILREETPEDVKLRRINHLKEEVIPYWRHLAEVRSKEAEDLLAVYLKYNGPDGILKRCSQEYDEIKARIAADDTPFVKILESEDYDDCSPRKNIYRNMVTEFENERGINPREAKKQSDQLDDIEHARALLKPTISLVPCATIVGIPHHHNKNPDDDPSWNVLLLEVLHRLMAEKDGEPFIDEVDETEFKDYYLDCRRPRYLKFIEQGLKSDTSVGYGSTSFFNDMHQLFWNCRYYNGPESKYATRGANLESIMKTLLREMGPVGEKLLGLESWPDPESIYFQPGFNKRLPDYQQEPDRSYVRHLAREQFRLGQGRVQQLRSRLATTANSTGQGADESPVEGEAQPGGESRKRPREEDADATEEGLNHEPKRQRSYRDATPGPSNVGRLSPRRASAERLRASADNATDDVPEDEDAEVIEVQGPGASKQKQPTGEPAYSGAPGPSPGAGGSSYNVPSQAGRKRARTPDADDSEGDDVEAEDGRGPEGSKRRRLMKGAPSASHPLASPEAVPATPRQATPEPGDVEPGSAQSHLTSPAGPPTPQPVSLPTQYAVPSSRFLKFSRNAIPMSKIVKMGKKRPWLFGYKTAEGYGIYAFTTCPRGNCKHHFSSHPLRDYRAQDHILGCNQQIRDERDMVRQYARQVTKDEGRKSDLTIDWARKSNLHLLPANQQDNHPENFPLAPAEDDDDEEEEEA
ncbi:Histone acetyltransferase kat2b [Diaporthe eres]|uniref:Histone acetyltransferase kat2b n=1 Tax=Diaporthe eres TaxID=83184 RepID=A0ABR1PIL2_DIAER